MGKRSKETREPTDSRLHRRVGQKAVCLEDAAGQGAGRVRLKVGRDSTEWGPQRRGRRVGEQNVRTVEVKSLNLGQTPSLLIQDLPLTHCMTLSN